MSSAPQKFSRSILATALLLLASTSLVAGIGGGPFVSGFIEGGVDNDAITDIAQLPDGDFVVVGSMPLSEPWGDTYGFDGTHNGSDDGFVAILDGDLKKVKLFTFIGGPKNDHITAVKVRNDGTIVIVGDSESDNLPVTVGAVGPVYSNRIDGFVIGLAIDLEEVKFCTYIVGDGDEIPTGLDIDENNAIFVCGTTTSRTGFPTTNAFDREHDGGRDGFLCRLSPNAGAYQFSTYFGSDGDDIFNSVVVDESGSIYLAGTTTSASYPTYPTIQDRWRWWLTKERPYDWTYGGGNSDATLTIFSQDGAQVITSTFFGGTGADEGIGVVLLEEAVVLVGNTTSEDLEADGGLQPGLLGGSDAFLARLDLEARTLRSATYFGGSQSERVDGATLYGQADVLLWGTTQSTDLPTSGFGTRSGRIGAEDAFFTVMNTGGIQFSSLIGGPGTESFSSAIVENDGGIVLCGLTASPFIALEEPNVLMNSAAGTTDGIAIRFQRGGIDLSTPSSSILSCFGTDVSFAWSTNEMKPDEIYALDVRTEEGEWVEVLSPINRNSARWTPDNAEWIGQALRARIRSERRHVTELNGTIRIDPELAFDSPLPEETVLCSFESTTLRANTRGVDLTYMWLKDGNVISGETADSLVIDDADKDGRYTVQVSAACGSALTSNGAIIRTINDVVITQQPRDVTVSEGESIDISVTAADAISYQWYRNEEAIVGATSNRLVISNASTENAGRYLCVIKNRCGERASDEATVVVNPTVSVDEDVARNFSLTAHFASSNNRIDVRLTVVRPNTNVQLIALDGSQITMTTVEVSGTAEVSFDASSLSAGTYIVHVDDGRNTAQALIQIVR